MKKYLLIALTALLCTGCEDASISDVTDQAMNIIQAEDENVLAIKNASPHSYNNTTYGEAFDSFFAYPAWKYFVGTQEGADENGDGEPDYTVDNVEVVEFTGYCEYRDVEVKALIQFTMNKDEGTFEATYLSINDIPQNYFMLNGLLEKVFENAPDSTLSYDSEEIVTTIAESNYEVSKVTSATSKIHNESKKSEIKATAMPVDIPAFEGNWTDEYSRRCSMAITLNGDIYSIKINWSSGALYNTEWTMSGKYDADKKAIIYNNCKQVDIEYNDGSSERETIFSNGKGRIYMKGNALCWEDDNYENSYNTLFFSSEYTETEPLSDPLIDEELVAFVYIDGGYLNVRSSASLNGSIIGKLYAGDEVTVYDWEGDWCKIKYNGKTGYVHSDYLIF